MSVSLTKYDIGLDGQGYIVKPGSYSKKIYHSNTERVINQGLSNQKQEEILLSDASVFRFFSQTDWSGGFNHPQLDADNVFKSSYNIDINRKTGEFRLARQFSGNRLATAGDVVTAVSAVITSAASTFTTATVKPGDTVRINSGLDRGSYVVKTVDSETQITLTTSLTTVATGISIAVFQDHPILPITTGAEVMDASETGYDITAIDGLPASGTIRVDGEEMTYTGLTPGTGAGTLAVTRGVNGTYGAAHSNGASIEFVSPITRSVVFANRFIVALGKYIFSSGDALTWTLEKITAADVTDMVVCSGVLVVAAGTDGIYHSKDGTGTYTNLAGTYNYLCAFENGGVEYLILAASSTFSRATYADAGAGTWTPTVIKTLSANETNFLLKPVVFRGIVYVWCNRGSQTLGRSDLYVYDATNFTRFLYDTAYPKATDMIARDNELIYAEDQGLGVAIKSFDGSSSTLLGIMESAPGGTQWGTVQYNTTQYGAGSELITSPFFGIDFEGRFGFSLKSTSTVNYIYTYEGQDDSGNGIFSRMNLLDSLGSNYTSFGQFQKAVWFGDSKGRLRKMQNDYVYSGQLISSELDVNLPNIKKLWATMDVLSVSLPSDTSMVVEFSASDGSWYTAPAHSGTGGTGAISSRFDLSSASIPYIANGIVTEKLNYRITLKGTTNSSPVVRDINIRYFSVPDRKHVWQMQLLCLDGIVLLNNTADTQGAESLIGAIDTTLAKNTTVTLDDYDGTSYTVLCDRNYEKQSWIETDSGNQNAIYTVNLLET